MYFEYPSTLFSSSFFETWTILEVDTNGITLDAQYFM